MQWNRLLNQIFPQYCLQCRKPATVMGLLCENCNKILPRRHNPLHMTHGLTCYSVFDYEGCIPQMMQKMKFQHQLQYCTFFANALALSLKNHYEQLPDLILPIPLHTKRLRHRGFNQSVEIAKGIQRQIPIAIDTQSLIRIKHTAPQTLIQKKERQKNLKNAFQQKKPVNAKHIILLDDVITTGITIATAIKALELPEKTIIETWSIATATKSFDIC